MKLQYMCLDAALDLWPPVILSMEFSLLGSGVQTGVCSLGLFLCN